MMVFTDVSNQDIVCPPVPIKSIKHVRWLRVALCTLIAAAVVSQSWSIWQIYSLRHDVRNLKWSDAVSDRDGDNDRDGDSEITADVGSIQFVKRGGYSILFDTAKYTSDGLYLHGVVGNPTRLNISNLSLKLTATKQLYQYREDFEKDPYIMLLGPPAIGEAQSSPIMYLSSGMTEGFEITIPNVKQTKEGVRLVVSFNGERYSY